ncbi:hypothetical protein TNCV_4867241 [Trichonephila clavipes]|nr:hypothetical protein TNCV_4867241 [Trichonephila clavipes]
MVSVAQLKYVEIIGVTISAQDSFVARWIYNKFHQARGPHWYWRPLEAARSASRLIRLCTGAPTCVTTLPLTDLSFLKQSPERVLIQAPLGTSYASILLVNENSVLKCIYSHVHS